MIRKCSKHPKYKAIREPVSCLECRVIWLEQQLTKLKHDFQNHSHYHKQYGGHGLTIEQED